MSLLRKLFFSFGLCVFLSYSIIAFCLFELWTQNKANNAFYESSSRITAATQIAGLGPTAMKIIQAAYLNSNIDEIESEWFTEFKGSSTGQLEGLNAYSTEETKELILAIKQNYDSMTDLFETKILKILKDKGSTDSRLKSLYDEINIKASNLGDAALRFRNVISSDVETQKNAIEKKNSKILIFTITLSFILLIGLLFVVFFVARSISKPLEVAISELNAQSEETLDVSQKIIENTKTLLEVTTNQMSAITETSSAVEEVNSMIQKSAENAIVSERSAKKSAEIANEGKDISIEMQHAMKEITSSNDLVLKSIHESHKQINEISDIINEIGSKTQIINDIVFQTKLLSFNASVEAARAGEQGKGFAVVAEEVGNLAQLSGNAAKEISDMLDSSRMTVERIVQDSTTEVTKLFELGREKVILGSEKATTTISFLDEISQQASSVNQLVNEISIAAAEQAKGVDEISKAMGELNRLMNDTSLSTSDLTKMSEGLQTQADSLKVVVNSLSSLVWGNK